MSDDGTHLVNLVSPRQYAEGHDLSLRQVQRYLADGRLPDAVKLNGTWSIPADAVPLPFSDAPMSSDVVTTSQGHFVPMSYGPVVLASREIPPGLWTLEEIAAHWDTSVGGVRRLLARGHLGDLGPYGRDGQHRVYVPARGEPRD